MMTRACVTLTLNAPTISQVQLRVQLEENLLELASVIKGEIRVDANVFRITILEISFDSLIGFILFTR